MKTGYFITAFVSSALLLTSCKKDAPILQNTKPREALINISGYTAYDIQGNLTGPIDTADWLKNVEIPDSVNSLFTKVTDEENYTGVSDIFTLKTILAYPNPFKNAVNLRIEVSDVAVVKLMIVDSDLRVKFATTKKLIPGENTLAFWLGDVTSQSLHRIYYQFYNNNKQLLYKGFGDIKKN